MMNTEMGKLVVKILAEVAYTLDDVFEDYFDKATDESLEELQDEFNRAVSDEEFIRKVKREISEELCMMADEAYRSDEELYSGILAKFGEPETADFLVDSLIGGVFSEE